MPLHGDRMVSPFSYELLTGQQAYRVLTAVLLMIPAIVLFLAIEWSGSWG